MKQTKVVILSWDILVNISNELYYECYLAAFKAINSPKAKTWTLQDTVSLTGISPSRIWESEILWGEWSEVAKEAYYNHYQANNHKIKLKSGAKELITALCQKGCRIVILSAKTNALLCKEVTKSEVAEQIDLIIGSKGDSSFDKPAFGCLQKAIEGVEISDKKTEVLFIGKEKDRKFAESFGMNFMYVQDDEEGYSLDELKAIIEGL